MSMVAFLPIVYEGKPPRFGEQPVNTRARGYSGTNYFKSTADDRYMPKAEWAAIKSVFNTRKDHPGNTRHVTRGTN